MGNDDHLDPDGFAGDVRRKKWRVFKEKLPDVDGPMWAVWDEFDGERIFRTGREALAFVHFELVRRGLAAVVSERTRALAGDR